MRKLLLLLLVTSTSISATPRFVAYDIYLDAPLPLAAWQFELSGGGMQVVGIENGAIDVFGEAPYYDRAAVEAGTVDRLIVADFSTATAARLPQGKTRIATVHLMLSDDTQAPHVELTTAVTPNGETMNARLSIEAR